MFWNLVNQLWLNRRTLYGSLGIMFGAIIISRTQHNSPPDYSSCTNIISIQSNVPSYSDIQLYLFNSTTTDPDTSCINVLASPGDTVLLDSIPAGTEVPCENYNLPSKLNCEGWGVLNAEQIFFIRMFKSEWERLNNTKSTGASLQRQINNNLANPDARVRLRLTLYLELLNQQVKIKLQHLKQFKNYDNMVKVTKIFLLILKMVSSKVVNLNQLTAHTL